MAFVEMLKCFCIKFLEAQDRVEDLIDQLQKSHGDTKKHQEINEFLGDVFVLL